MSTTSDDSGEFGSLPPGPGDGSPPAPRPRSHRRRRARWRGLIVLVLVPIVVVILAVTAWYQLNEHALGPAGRQQVIIVRPGESEGTVLERAGLAPHHRQHPGLPPVRPARRQR